MDIIYPDKYFNKIKEEFPELSEAQIKDIVYYGIRSIFMMSYYGIDVKCQQGKFFVYFGELVRNQECYERYRVARLSAKYRMLYKRMKLPFSGKYYAMLTKDMHDKMPKKKKGGEWPMSNLKIYKIQEEAQLHKGTYLYEIDWNEDIGYKGLISTKDITHYKCLAKRKDYRTFEPLSTDYKEATIKRKLKGR